MTENVQGLRRVKHISLKHHYVCEMIENGLVKIIFTEFASNKADIFTRVLEEEHHKEHVYSVVSHWYLAYWLRCVLKCKVCTRTNASYQLSSSRYQVVKQLTSWFSHVGMIHQYVWSTVVDMCLYVNDSVVQLPCST